MNTSDLINGFFECAGAIFIIPSIVDAIKTKKINGINWITLIFMISWGFWNMYFYPHNGLMLSFYGGVALSAANVAWLVCIIKYKYLKNK